MKARQTKLFVHTPGCVKKTLANGRGSLPEPNKNALAQEEWMAARVYAEAVIEVVPALLVLDKDLRVQTANEAFCKCFKISSNEAVNRRVYELGNGQWDIPELRTLLEEVLPQKSVFKGFEVTHTFESIGTRTMLVSGRQVNQLQRMLLLIEDVTESWRAKATIRRSEIRYRRPFETSRDGILILDPETRRIMVKSFTDFWLTHNTLPKASFPADPEGAMHNLIVRPGNRRVPKIPPPHSSN